MPVPTRRRLPFAVVVLAVLALAAAWSVTTGGQSADASQSEASGLFRCQHPTRAWTEIASGPNSFAIGNCRSYVKKEKDPADQTRPPDPGTPYTRVRHSNSIGTGKKGWEIGIVGGSFDGCGVVKRNESRAVKKSVTTKDCDRFPSQGPRSDFVANTDCEPISYGKGRRRHRHTCRWDAGKNSAHGDVDTLLVRSCMAYANVRPFSRTPKAIDPVGMLTAQTQVRYPFKRRWLTKRTLVDPADGQPKRFVLGFLGKPSEKKEGSGAPATMPQWVFVAEDCVTSPHAWEGIGKDPKRPN